MTRIGASQVFFNIVAQFNAEKLIKDYRSINTVMKAVSLDTFEAILKPVEGLGQAINSITDELGPLQEALGLAAVEFEKFFGQTPAIEQMRDSVMDLGAAYAQTGVEALAAGSRASQVANLIGRGNVNTLVELSLTLAEISDLNAEEAQRGIIQLHQQTGMLFGEMNREAFLRLSLTEQQTVLTIEGAKALDALNTIANRSVALEGDLVRVMGTFAAQGELVGDSFEFMAAASATLLEAGEEQGTAGRALRMMYARLGGDISGARTQIEAMGFELTDTNGNMKTMQEVLTELSDKGWNNLAGAEKQAIAQTIAGNRHYVRFIKLMENYDRTMQLAADGAKGFDSALGQANVALSSQVKLLQKAQVINENYKAKIGEGLSPFMRGEVEAQNDYLAVTEVLTDSLGELGVVLGRMKGTFEVMGSFIKVGLATQSFGIGLEMFTSVQRQLNGILVANEHLHSKQANYYEYGVKQTATQRDLMSGMQFIQQKINMHAEKRRANEKVLVPLLNTQKEIQQQMLGVEERREITTAKFFQLSGAQASAGRLRLANLEQQDSLYAKRMARLQYEKAMEGSMLQDAKAMREQQDATDEAHMRQYLADLQVAAQLTDEELNNIRKRHELLRAEHLLLQTLKSDNEIRYRSQGGNRDGLAMPVNLEFGASTVAMSDHERQFIAEKMELFSEEATAQLVRKHITKTDKGTINQKTLMSRVYKSQDIDQIGLLQDSLNGMSLATKVLDHDTEAYTSGEAKLLEKMMTSTQGQFIQTSKSLNTYTAMTKDQIKVGSELNNLDFLLVKTKSQLEGQNREMIDLSRIDKALMEEIAPLMKIINNEKSKEAERNKALIELQSNLNKKKGKLSAHAASYLQQEKEELKFSQDKTMAMRQFGFAIQNSVGLLSGMAGGALGASMSLAFMAGNLITAGQGAAKAATQMMSLQKAQTLSILKHKELTIATELQTTAAQKNAIANRSAAISLGLMVAPYLAIGAALYIFTKRAEKAATGLSKLNDQALGFENQMQSISRDKKILGDDDSLAKAIGIDNMSTGEILDSGADINAMIKTLQGTMGQYTDQQNTQIENALKYLKIIQATNDMAANLLNKELFAQNARDAMAEMGPMMAVWDSLGEEAGEQLYDSINRVGMDFYSSTGGPATIVDHRGKLAFAASANLQDLIGYMEYGNKLSQEQLALAEEYFNDEQITAHLRNMNALVMTDEIRIANQYDLAASIEVTNNAIAGEADEIQNLTDEIYNFSGAREELFFGGKYGNVTGSLYKTVVKQGVGTLYHKNEVIMTTNFHGFFNEQEAAHKITAIVNQVLAN